MFQVPQRAVLYDDNLIQQIAVYYNPNPPPPPQHEARQSLNAKFESAKLKEDQERFRKSMFPQRPNETAESYTKRYSKHKKQMKKEFKRL